MPRRVATVERALSMELIADVAAPVDVTSTSAARSDAVKASKV